MRDGMLFNQRHCKIDIEEINKLPLRQKLGFADAANSSFWDYGGGGGILRIIH